jgi:segregation and condensation protein B
VYGDEIPELPVEEGPNVEDEDVSDASEVETLLVQEVEVEVEVEVEEPDGDKPEEVPVDQEPDDLADAMERAKARTSGKIATLSEADSIDQRYIRRMIEYLNHDYDETNRAFRIVEVAGGFQFATVREYGSYVALLSKEKGRRRLSPAALETLAIIAYRQPVSKPEIEGIRGVNCDQVLLNLMEKNLVAITGRSEGVGRPLLYGTSEDFLRVFGLNNIADLPKLREIEELMEEGAQSAAKAEILMIEEGSEAEEIEARLGAMGHHSQSLEGEDGLPVESVEGEEPGAGEIGAGEGEAEEIVPADQEPEEHVAKTDGDEYLDTNIDVSEEEIQ